MRKLFLLIGLFSAVALSACGGDDTPSTKQDVKITVSPRDLKAPADGGTYTVSVTCTGKEWTAAPNSDSWLGVKVSGSTSQTGTVTITVSKNTATATRTSTVTVRSGSTREIITVEQEAAQEPLTVSETEIDLTSTGGTGIIAVSGRSQFQARTADNWLKADIQGSSIVITAEPNTTHKNRKGHISISDPNTSGAGSSAVVTVAQEGAEETDVTLPDWAKAEGYELVWHDEFNEGTTLNSKDWTHEVQGPGWVNNELQTYVNGQAGGQRVTELVDGKLRINCFLNGKVYSGRVYAHVSEGWQFGYIEARLQLPKGKGTWPAFWMMPVTTDWQNEGWPKCGEIDIMEEVGANANYVSSSLHALGHYHANNTQITHEMLCSGAEDDFHTYAIKWTEQNITTYVDGNVQLTYDNDGSGVVNWPYSKPFYIILNLAWGGDWGGYKGVDNSALPTTMKVDYVRVFQKP